jgi:hypothetical protein
MRRNESTFELEFALPIVEQRWARFAAAPDAVQARFEALADDRTRVQVVTEHGEAEDVAQAFRRFVWAQDVAHGSGGTSAVDTVVSADRKPK